MNVQIFSAHRRSIIGLTGIALAATTVSALALTGCNLQDCDAVQGDYEQALVRESALVELDDQGPPHLAMALRLDFVNDLTSSVLDRVIGEALDLGGSLNVSGQTLGFSLGSTGANLGLAASDRCDGCLQVAGDFDGDFSVDLPGLGSRSSPLKGGMDWVVPLSVGRDGGDAAIFLDTPEAARMGGLSLDARLDGLSSTWASPVASALSTEIASVLESRLNPIRLVGYALPDLGLGGLELTPSLFRLDGASNSLILGVRTNADVQTAMRSDQDFVDALSLSGGQNVALGIQPGFVVEAVRLGLREERIPRRYSTRGEARDDGPARAVVDDFRAGAHGSGGDAVGLGLDFRLFNFQTLQGLGCFSVDGLAESRLAIQDGQIALELENVDFTGGGGLIDAANWASAEFIESSQTVVSRSLNDDVISSAGLGVSLRGDRVSTDAGMLILRGVGSSN